MFWGCFSYDEKGPCHIWCPKSTAKKKAADDDLKVLNAALEPMLRAKWEEKEARWYEEARARDPQYAWHRNWRFKEATGKLVWRIGRSVD